MKLKENKVIKIIGKFIHILIVCSVILMCLFAFVQGTSNNRKSIAGLKIFTVVTGSMIPVYNIGDIIIVKEVAPEQIQVGDDIVYRGEKGSFQNKMVTHRVEEIYKKEDGNYKIITKGVANLGRDPEINQTQVYGKVLFKIPIVNFILRVVTNIYVWMFIPVVILIYINIKRLGEMKG